MPLTSEGCRSQGEALVEEGKYEEAVAVFTEGLEKAGSVVSRLFGAARQEDLLSGRARAFVSMNQHEKALADLNEALGFDADDLPSRTLRLRCLFELVRYDEALADCEYLAEAMDPTPPDASLCRAGIFAAQNKPEEARKEFDEAVRVLRDEWGWDEGTEKALLARGRFLAGLREHQQAIEDFDSVIGHFEDGIEDYDPPYPQWIVEAYSERAKVHRSLENHQQAAQDHERADELKRARPERETI